MPDTSLVTGILGSAGAGTAIMVILFLSGLIWTKPSVDEIKRQRDQANADKKTAEAQRDDAIAIAQTQIIPMLGSFTAASGALIPLLQALVARQEAEQSRRRDTR
ncbi:MAG TPA: hypothetical protein VGG54_22630 [Trebonia sp.]